MCMSTCRSDSSGFVQESVARKHRQLMTTSMFQEVCTSTGCQRVQNNRFHSLLMLCWERFLQEILWISGRALDFVLRSNTFDLSYNTVCKEQGYISQFNSIVSHPVCVSWYLFSRQEETGLSRGMDDQLRDVQQVEGGMSAMAALRKDGCSVWQMGDWHGVARFVLAPQQYIGSFVL